MTETFFSDIRAFHEKFGLPGNPRPGFLPPELERFRYAFLAEELAEYRAAVADANLPDVVDALVDLVYVALGTAYLHGFDFPAHWEIVQRANMLKVRAATAAASKRGTAFDVVKPPGWVAPDHRPLLARPGSR